MTQEKTQSIRKTNTYAMAVTALMTAVTCILAPMSIPIGPVPISLTNFAIYLSLYLLDWKKGTLSYFVYLLIGFAGLPVFSGFTGGIGKLLSASAMTSGRSTSKWNGNSPLPTTSISACVNSRKRPSCGRSPRQTFCIW